MKGLQERAARGIPAEQVEDVDGWLLRLAPSSAWWVGTVLPHGAAGPGDVVRRVVATEEFYAGHGVATRFQITPGVCPGGLDTVLAERGYHRHGSASLQVATTAQVRERAPTGSLEVRLDERPTSAWLAAWHAVHGSGNDVRTERDLLDRVQQPCAYAGAMLGDDVVAVGRVVGDTGWAGVFGMATLPEARGKGAARDVLGALAGWAGAHGADRMYLQVERDNAAALRLYELAGFREVRGYHYRAAG